MSTFQEEKQRGLDDVYSKAAREVLADLELVLAEPKLDTRPSDLRGFAALDKAWFARTTTILEGRGYRHLRDLDATALTAKGAPPMCVRVMLAEDGRTSVALYQAVPRSPGKLIKAVLWLMRKWQKPCVVEFVSYTEDERVIGTSNQGEVNQFSPPPNCLRRSLPLSASVLEVLAAHEAHVASSNARLRSFGGFDDLDAAREAQRQKQNAWRLEVGLLPEELDRMLAPHGESGVKLRPYIERALAERRG